MKTLREFYLDIQSDYEKAHDRVEKYLILANCAKVSKEKYENDSVYVSLLEKSERLRFVRNLVMEAMKEQRD